MAKTTKLTNEEIALRFEKYMKLRYMPLGMYFSSVEPRGKIRTQGTIINRCIVGHIFKSAKGGGSSLIKAGSGCPVGQFWAGVSKQNMPGWDSFLAEGRNDVLGGRAARVKKDVNIATKISRDPGPLMLPDGMNFIIYCPLKEIPDDYPLEFILFFVNPDRLANLITLCQYSRHAPYMVNAPAGSGCMSILNFPLLMKKDPEPDAVMGVWDIYARGTIPRNMLTLAIRRWLVEEMAMDIPGSFLTHTRPFTFWGEIKHFFKKLKREKKNC